MNAPLRKYIAAVAIITTTIVVLILIHNLRERSYAPMDTGVSQLDRASPLGNAPNVPGNRNFVSDGTKKSDPKSDSDRKSKLLALKRQWLELGEGTIDTEERQRLSKESAELLLCSNEALQLIEFLDERGYYNTIKLQIGTLFNSPFAAEARGLLTKLLDQPYSNRDSTNYKELWSKEAGKWCPVSEFDTFKAALDSDRCEQEALFGQLQAMASDRPEEAIRLTLQELKTGTKSRSSNISIKELMGNLPSNSDFEKIAELLPNVKPNDNSSPVGLSLPVFFEKWANQNPAEAANYVMAFPEKFSPQLIRPIANAVLIKGPWAGVEWVQTFPDGPYFDIAAGIAVDYLRGDYPSEAKQLADLIGNPELRKRSMKRAETPQEETKNVH